MKKKLVLVVLMWCLFIGIANATILTFDTGPNGLTLGGGMSWTNFGGGHLYKSDYSNTSYIIFGQDTFINDFQMNYQPWENYGSNPANDSGWLLGISALDSVDNILWSQSVDLTSTANDWSNWITILVNTGNVRKLTFSPTGGDFANNYLPTGYWPSIDNIDTADPIPEPATLFLLGTGLVGLVGSRFRKRR